MNWLISLIDENISFGEFMEDEEAIWDLFLQCL